MAVANAQRSLNGPLLASPARVSPRIAPLLETRTPWYREALATLERFARHDCVHVLLAGESGTGKTILAQRLHDLSPRAGRVFHRVALSAVADSLAASDLFGHLQGAFTDARARRAGHFASAHGGTLFLDEIAKASLVVQHNLLDAVERQEIAPVGADRSVRVDVRIVAATNVCLRSLVEEGKFLPDLLARLDGFVVRVPPLRERRADIALLVKHFVELHAPTLGYPRAPAIDPELMAALTAADWPGNVRELDVAVRRLLIEGEGAPTITLRECVDFLGHLRPSRKGRITAEQIALEVEKQGNVAAAARKLGMSRTTVYRYLECAMTRPAEVERSIAPVNTSNVSTEQPPTPPAAATGRA